MLGRAACVLFGVSCLLGAGVGERLLQKAQQMIAGKKYSDAITQCTQLIRWKPDLAEAYEVRGLAYAYSGNRAKALDDYTEAIRRDSRLASAYEKRARLRQASGEMNAAIADYTALIEMKPNEPSYYRLRSYLYLITNRKTDALRDADQVMLLAPNCAECLKYRILVSTTEAR